MGKIEGLPNPCCKSGRDVPGTCAPDSYRSVSSISCSRCSSSYCNRLHRDQRFLFDLRDCPPDPSNRGSRIRLTHALVEEQTLVSSLNSKLSAVPLRIGTHIFCGRRRARRYSPGSCLCCTSMISNAPRVNDGSRLAGTEAALRRFWEVYLGFQVSKAR